MRSVIGRIALPPRPGGRFPAVADRHDPGEEDQPRRHPPAGVQHLQREPPRHRDRLASPAADRAQQVNAREEQDRGEEEDHEHQRRLARQVGDVGQQREAARQQRQPGVAPAEDRPGREVGDQPDGPHQQQDERQGVRGDATSEESRQPVAHPAPQIAPTRGDPEPRGEGVGQLHRVQHHRRGDRDPERDASEEQRPRPRTEAGQQRADHQPDRGRHRQGRHLVDPVRASDREGHGELGDREQREADPVFPEAPGGHAARIGFGEQIAQATGAEACLAGRAVRERGHAYTPPRSPTPTDESTCTRSSWRFTV